MKNFLKIFTLFILFVAFQFPHKRKQLILPNSKKQSNEELAATKTPGASVAIISGDKIIFAKGFGTTSAENGNPVTADTLFRMGSTTKMFTAAALVSLAEQGKIKLDAPIGNYIKNLPPKISAFNRASAFSQSSGLRDFAPTVHSQ